MKPQSDHRYHIHFSEALDGGRVSFAFRRLDLRRTATLYSSAPVDSDADEEVGLLILNAVRVHDGFYLGNIEFSLAVDVSCVYCLETARCTIADKARVEFKNDNAAGSYFFSANQSFDCRELFEEEVLLRAPLNPRHESCSTDNAPVSDAGSFVTISQAGDGQSDSKGATWRPFANIRSLGDS